MYLRGNQKHSKLVIFDLWGTLVLPTSELKNEIALRIARYLQSLGYEVDFTFVSNVFRDTLRLSKVRVIENFEYVTPTITIQQFLRKLATKYSINVTDELVIEVSKVISSTLLSALELGKVKIDNDAQNVLRTFKEEEFIVVVLSNNLLWNSETIRKFVSLLPFSKYIDFQVWGLFI